MHFCENLITSRGSFREFVGDLQDVWRNLNVGILRVERADLDESTFTLLVAEGLDCSGLPVYDEEVCAYDEGFIAGLLAGVYKISLPTAGDRVRISTSSRAQATES